MNRAFLKVSYSNGVVGEEWIDAFGLEEACMKIINRSGELYAQNAVILKFCWPISRSFPMLASTHVALLKSAGFSDINLADAHRAMDVAVAMGFNWQLLLDILVQYGPTIVAMILKLFNLSPTPPQPPAP